MKTDSHKIQPFLLQSDLLKERLDIDDGDLLFIPVASTEAGFVILMSFFRQTKALADKNSEVLVAGSAEFSLYNTLIKRSFPTNHATPATRGLIVRHELGFPQRMFEIIKTATEHQWFVIEDFSQCLPTVLKTKTLELHGDAGCLKLSNGAVIVTRRSDVASFAQTLLAQNTNRPLSLLGYSARLMASRFGEHLLFAKEAASSFEAMFSNICDQDLKFQGDVPAMLPDLRVRDDFAKRIENYRYFAAQFRGYAPLTLDDFPNIVPFKFPLYGERRKLALVQSGLKTAGFETRLTVFDRNRNITALKNQDCLELPVEGTLTLQNRETIADITLKLMDKT